MVIQVLAWTPPAVAVLYVLVSFVWAMFHSQRQRIQSALKGTKGNVAAQLGFMNKVKTEVRFARTCFFSLRILCKCFYTYMELL